MISSLKDFQRESALRLDFRLASLTCLFPSSLPLILIIIVGVSKTGNAIPLGARPTFPTFPQVVWLEESLVLKKAVSKSLFLPRVFYIPL